MNASRIAIMTLLLAALAPLAQAGPTDLSNNDQIRLMGTAGTSRLYRIYVPEYQNRLEITTSGGQGDLDLFVQAGSEPTTRSAQYRSVGRDNNESVNVHNPRSGWWYLLVTSYRSYIGATMQVRYWGNDGGVVQQPGGDWDYKKPDSPQPGQNGQVLLNGRSLTDLAGYARSERVFRIEVPNGARKLTVTSQGHTGDPDLYLRQGFVPQRNRYEAKSISSGANESITQINPAAGTWYLLVYGYRPYSGLTLSLDLDRGFGGGHPGWPRPRPGRSSLTLINPTGDEVWTLGNTHTIRWRATGRARLARVQVQYSLDNGRTWQRGENMPQSMLAATESLQVTLPANARQFLTNQARVRIVDVDRREVLALSGVFSVRQEAGHGRPWPGRRPRPRARRRDIQPDAFENDNRFKRPSHIQLNTMQNRTIHDEDEVDYIRFPVPHAGTYRISLEALDGFELKGELHVRRKDHDDRRIASFEIDNQRKYLVVNADSKTYWYTLTVRAEDDDERGAYRLVVGEN